MLKIEKYSTCHKMQRTIIRLLFCKRKHYASDEHSQPLLMCPRQDTTSTTSEMDPQHVGMDS